MQKENLFADSDPPATGETCAALLDHRNLVIERILSSNGPKSGVYEQRQDEWVLLLRGQAVLQVQETRVELRAGDHVFIPAGTSHTVETTSGEALWLAVHLHPTSSD